MVDESPYSVIIHIGSNDITKSNYNNVNVEDLAKKITNINVKCKAFKVSNIAISSILVRSDPKINQVIKQANRLLQGMCKTSIFYFICNNVIDTTFLWKDGLHLTYEGISKLSDNFLEYLTSFLLPSNDFNVNECNNNLDFSQSHNSDISIDIKETMQKSKITGNCKSTSTADLDCVSRFKEIRTQKFSNVIIDNLNINSLAFKLDELRLLATGIFGILIITETKLDDKFPLSQFHIDGFSTPYRLGTEIVVV